jgi:hypothetical protein
MPWELRRLREGRGYVGKRIRFKATYLCQLIYGFYFYKDGRVVMPEEVYIMEHQCEC